MKLWDTTFADAAEYSIGDGLDLRTVRGGELELVGRAGAGERERRGRDEHNGGNAGNGNGDDGNAGAGAGVGDGTVVASVVPVARSAPSGRISALLLIAPGAVVHLNGYPALAATVLADRDELRIGRHRLLFAAWDASRIEPYRIDAGVGPDAAARNCAVCSAALADGDPVRACPACGARCHAGRDGDDEDAPLVPACDLEDARCAGCGRDRAAMTWTPDDLVAATEADAETGAWARAGGGDRDA